MGKDQFGDGGTRRIPKEKIDKAKQPPPPKPKDEKPPK